MKYFVVGKDPFPECRKCVYLDAEFDGRLLYTDHETGKKYITAICADGKCQCIRRVKAGKGESMLGQRLRRDFQKEVGNWGNLTFRKSTARSAINHLKREVKELERATEPEEIAEEAADCYLILLHLAHKIKFDLFLEAQRKFSIVQTRKWKKPDKEGVCEHIPDKQKAGKGRA